LASSTIVGRRCLTARSRSWGRLSDIKAVLGIALRQHGRFDERLIWSELTPLLELKEAPDAAQRLRALLARAVK